MVTATSMRRGRLPTIMMLLVSIGIGIGMTSAALVTSQYDTVDHLFKESDKTEVFTPPTLGVFYYPWHGDDFHRGDGYMREMLDPKHQPSLGEYDDSLPETVSQHLKWSRRANIKVWFASWWGPGMREDNTIRNTIMEHPELGDNKIAVLYETTGRMKETEDWDPARVRTDAIYLCEHYFKHPAYYKIDGKAVIFAYLTRMLSGRNVLHQLVDTLRENCDVPLFILGDQIWQAAPGETVDYEAFDYLDGITNYDIYGNTANPPYATQAVVDNYYDQQQMWKTRAKADSVHYVPNTSPGYNDRGVRIGSDHVGLSRRLTADDHPGSLFVAQLRRARQLTDSMAGNLMLVNSFNEWHEDSCVEPVSGQPTTVPFNVTGGLEYDGYGTLYLDILHAATCTDGSACSTEHYGLPDEFDYSKGPNDDGQSSDTRGISLRGPFDGLPPPGITVGAYYYAWYAGEDFNSNIGYIRNRLDNPQTPMLGEYNDREVAVLAQHFEWSRQANINMWAVLWQRPNNKADTTLQAHILPHPSIGDHKIALIYQIYPRITFSEDSAGIGDGGRVPIFDRVRDDIEYLCKNYFKHHNYYRVGERPVLFLSISRALHDVNALDEAAIAVREVAHLHEFDIFLIGDQVWSAPPNVGEPYAPFMDLDAVTNHDVYGNLGLEGYAGQEAVDKFYSEQMQWRDRAWQNQCGFVPSVTTGFNNGGDRALSRRLTADSEEGSLFSAGLQKAQYLVDPFVNNLLMVNSFNQWHEDTQIEPVIGVSSSTPESVTRGFTYEPYGTKYLDILAGLTAKSQELRISQSTPDSCNVDPRFDDKNCLGWISQFGDQDEYNYKVIIPCGRCVKLDATRPSINFTKGLEILGKLIIPDDSVIDIKVTYLVVKGDLVAPASAF